MIKTELEEKKKYKEFRNLLDVSSGTSNQHWKRYADRIYAWHLEELEKLEKKG